MRNGSVVLALFFLIFLQQNGVVVRVVVRSYYLEEKKKKANFKTFDLDWPSLKETLILVSTRAIDHMLCTV